MADEKNQKACWYVVHTYAGYENKVRDTLLKAVENNDMQDLILDVQVPMEEVEEIRGGRRVKSKRKVYPSYVLVHMIETTKSWYVVRNTRGVTGFVGPDSRPIALTDEEVATMLATQEKSVKFDIAIGEEVRILDGPLKDLNGVVEDLDTVRNTIKVRVNNFMGKQVSIEYASDQVARI